MQNVPVSRQVGLTLIELVVVIGVIAVIAAIAAPGLSSGSSKELDLAAAEIAAAMRFARAESIRTGNPHGFRFLPNQETVRVFSADMSASPAAMVFDIYHPVSKQLYDYTLPSDLWGSGNPVTENHVFRGTCNDPNIILFNANGTPWCRDPQDILLESFALNIDAGSDQAIVSLDGITGRVAVQ